MHKKSALLTVITLAIAAYAGSAAAAVPNFTASCPMNIQVKAQGGNVFINGKKATLKTDAPTAYTAQSGKIMIGITSDSATSEPSVDYAIKHDKRANGICTVSAWSAGKAATLPMAKGDSPYQGKWTAKNSETGATVANIQVDGKEQVWVNGVKVKAKRADGALQFRQGTILYTLQGDPRIRYESDWNDSDAQNTGPITLE
ncbi:hypothetical protein [Aeromonas veronii]|uniref:hypothetical protein n=1 Tax=Aeromonas veronii TaxID=654 RepID=UPI001A90888E|nr:hypothetical protein [Aeromonas veronii]QSR48038.1 hypothetical protein HUI97_12085 [Aeromonas veronii]